VERRRRRKKGRWVCDPVRKKERKKKQKKKKRNKYGNINISIRLQKQNK